MGDFGFDEARILSQSKFDRTIEVGQQFDNLITFIPGQVINCRRRRTGTCPLFGRNIIAQY
jgi:hypothetical protein